MQLFDRIWSWAESLVEHSLLKCCDGALANATTILVLYVYAYCNCCNRNEYNVPTCDWHRSICPYNFSNLVGRCSMLRKSYYQQYTKKTSKTTCRKDSTQAFSYGVLSFCPEALIRQKVQNFVCEIENSLWFRLVWFDYEARFYSRSDSILLVPHLFSC